MTTPGLTISRIAATSPSLAEDMRLCGLRAGLGANRNADKWVLHDPRMWLGTAFHRLIQRAHGGLDSSNVGAAWDEEIVRLLEAASLHPLDTRFSDPEAWSGYQLIRIRAIRSAEEVIGNRHRPLRPKHSASGAGGIERRLSARKGRLVGRPDAYSKKQVTDYKVSLPLENSPGREEVLTRFKRQLQIYAAIIAEGTGHWVREGVVQAGSGQSIRYQLVPADCDREADDAVALLDSWNRDLTKSGVQALAQPSATACAGCRFQSICPPFWSKMRQSVLRIESARTAALGTLTAVQTGGDPDLQTLLFRSVLTSSGAEALPALAIRKSIHGTALDCGFRLKPAGYSEAKPATVPI